MRLHFATRLAAAAVAVLGFAARASGLVIDDFTIAQGPLTATLIGAGPSDSVSDAGILGGERDTYLVLQAGLSSTVNVTGGAAAYSEAAPASDGELWFSYDGADDTAVINHTGLGGIDLTAGGTQDGFSVQILLNPTLATNLGFLVHTDAANYSIVNFSAPAGASTQIVPFSSFTTLAGSGANFTNIGAVSFFSMPGVVNQNMQFGTIQTVPEPATGLLFGLGLLVVALRPR